MSRGQAIRCTRKELAYLAHWRSKGFMLRINDQIPLNTVTPPSFATRRPVLNIVLAALIIASALSLFGFWFATAAKLV